MVNSNWIYKILSSTLSGQPDQCEDKASQTELDSHANMLVVGKRACVLAKSDKTIDVAQFTPDYKPMSVPMVDVVVQYDNPYEGKTYILEMRNALHVP